MRAPHGDENFALSCQNRGYSSVTIRVVESGDLTERSKYAVGNWTRRRKV